MTIDLNTFLDQKVFRSDDEFSPQLSKSHLSIEECESVEHQEPENLKLENNNNNNNNNNNSTHEQMNIRNSTSQVKFCLFPL